MVICGVANTLSYNFEDGSYIPLNIEYQREARHEQREMKTQRMTSDHMTEYLTLR